MYFTQEDYKKIENWLHRNSVKDTEFQEALPFTGTELVTVVQDGHNRKVNIQEFINQLYKHGVEDFLNVTNTYRANNITLKEAIRLIPAEARKEGQVITFLNTEGNWEIYQFTGKLNQWNNPTLWNNPFDWEKFVVDSILPDEEDLTKSAPDANGNAYLSLKDRKYEPDKYSGLGRKILRRRVVEIEDPIYGTQEKNLLLQADFAEDNTVYVVRYDFTLNGQDITLPDNSYIEYEGGSISDGNIIDRAGGINKVVLKKNIVNGKNILTQEMINKPNTIYEIRYDFDLGNANVLIPSNCVLKFNGGCLENGAIIGQNTVVFAEAQNTLFSSVDILGTWNNKISYPNWFINVSNAKVIEYSIIIADSVQIDGSYLLDDAINIEKSIRIFGNGRLSFSENVGGGVSLNKSGCIYIKSSNVCIDGLSFDSLNVGDSENIGASIIDILGDANNKLSNIIIKNCKFYGGENAITANYCVDSVFKNNNAKNITYSGIGIHSSEKITIDGNTFENININKYRINSYGICITYHSGGNPVSKDVVCVNNIVLNNPYWEGLDTHGGENIIFSNNVCRNCYVGIAAVSNDTERIIKNVIISNNTIEVSATESASGIRASGYASTSVCVPGKNVKISDNIIFGNGSDGIYGGCIENYQISNNQIEAIDVGIYLRWLTKGTKIDNNIIFLKYGSEQPLKYRCGIYLSKAIQQTDNDILLINNNSLNCKDVFGVVLQQNFHEYNILVNCCGNITRTSNNDKYKGGTGEINNIYYFQSIDDDCCLLKKNINSVSVGAGELLKIAEYTPANDGLPSFFSNLSYTILSHRGIQKMLLSEFHNGNALEIYLFNPTTNAINLGSNNYLISGKYFA